MLYLNVNLVLIIPLSIIRTAAVTLCMGAVSINSRCNYASDSTMVFVDEAGLLCSHNLSSGITSHNLTASTFVSDKYSGEQCSVVQFKSFARHKCQFIQPWVSVSVSLRWWWWWITGKRKWKCFSWSHQRRALFVSWEARKRFLDLYNSRLPGLPSSWPFPPRWATTWSGPGTPWGWSAWRTGESREYTNPLIMDI